MADRTVPSLAKVNRRNLQVGLLAVAVALLVAFASQLPGWRLLELRGFDTLSTTAPPAPPPDTPIIVAIDESSFAELQRQWPWPRSLHARLVQQLRAAGAKAIGLDIIFAEPSADPQADAALADALGPDVTLAGDETLIETPHADQIVRVEPLPEFVARGARPGIASIVLDADGTLRRVPRHADGFARVLAEAAGKTPADPPAGALIQAFGPARALQTVSYYQALDPAEFLPDGMFKDRVVIVGLSMQSAPTTESGGADAYETSWTLRSGRLVSGAEIQATIYANLVAGLTIAPLPASLSILSILAAALAAGLAVRRATGWLTAFIAVGAAGALVLLSFLLIRHAQIFLPMLAPCAAFMLVAATQAGIDYAGERRARRTITRAFSQYLSPVLVEQLAADPSQLKLGGERRTLSILFCDVRGFTTISERMKSEPEKLTRLVNRILGPLSQQVLDHGGTIDKYIGDCVMAFWNAPLDDPDHAFHAVETGLAMVAAMEALNVELAAEAEAEGSRHAPLRVGVGINTGDCVVGNMGSAFRFDYSALGDAVNLASRLEGQTKTYGVSMLLGEATARAVGERFAVIELDRVRVKGKSDVETVSTVIPGAEPAAIETHRALIADRQAGRLLPGDRRFSSLAVMLPALDAYYDWLKESMAAARQ